MTDSDVWRRFRSSSLMYLALAACVGAAIGWGLGDWSGLLFVGAVTVAVTLIAVGAAAVLVHSRSRS